MAVTNADILGWLNANPDASPELINKTMAEAGVSAAQYQSATGTPPPPVTQASTPQKVETLLQELVGNQTVNTIAPTETKVVGGPVQVLPPVPTVTNADILGWFNANPNADATLINKTMAEAGVSPQQVSAALSSNPDIAKSYLTQQILGQRTTSQWSGEGYGSAAANAADMAKILSSIGITDISQFGKVTKEVPTYDEFGTQIGTEKVETYGNKVTGQAVPNTYSERQTGNAFGGTFAGKGNTGYRVEFDASGKPVFYTTGASSSDIGSIMPLIQLGLAATGAGGLLGNALLGAGANQIAAGALGNALLGGATTGLAGGDALKGALLGGAGGALSGYLQNMPIDASNMTSAQFNDALENQLVKSMQGAGLSNAQISQWLENASPADIASVTSALPVTGASENLLVEAAKTPITASALTNVLSQVPTVAVTAKTPQQVSPDALNAVTSLLSGGNVGTPDVEVTAKKENQISIPTTMPTIGADLSLPEIPKGQVAGTDTNKSSLPVITPTPLTTSDIIKLLGIGTTVAGITAATGGGGGGTGGTQYQVVPIPSGWSPATATKVAPATTLPPIDFGDRNLLRGTQWEKFLDPNYGKVPAPIQYSQPSNLSYNDLMGILGSKQGYPSASNLSINDVISGIQNQYGQIPTSTMG